MWESTFDAITMPVQIVSHDYRIQRANLSFAEVGSREISTIIGEHCYEVFAGRSSPCEGCPLQQGLQEDRTVTSSIGHEIHDHQFEATAFPYEAEGGASSAILSYRDVTEERRLQQEIAQQEKMAAIGMLAGGVAHEINNPLGGILAFTQLILRSLPEESEISGDLKEIESAALRCKRIVADLLEFSRAPKKREENLVDLKALLDKILPFVRSEMQSLNIEFEFRCADDTPPVAGHVDRLQQVFLNLITNSCQAMPQGGKLTIAFSKGNHGGAEASVCDTGHGISSKDMKLIFDPFFTTKGPGKGTGLGLSISYRIVREHGGSILVKSKEGEGTCFILTFPSAEEIS